MLREKTLLKRKKTGSRIIREGFLKNAGSAYNKDDSKPTTTSRDSIEK